MGFEVRKLAKRYPSRNGEVTALLSVDLQVGEEEFVCIVGPSGCGKTTLLKSIAGLISPSEGQIIYTGEAVDRHLRTAMVFQDQGLFPWMTVQDNVAFGLETQGVPRRERRAQASDFLAKVGLAGFIRSYPHELSGGMRQRVLIALSLLLDPQLLILDEPTTALDILTQRNIMDVLNTLRKELSFSLIFISHDLSLAAELADRVATMYAGKIVEMASVYTIFKNPHHPYTIGLINAVPTLKGTKESLTSIPGQPPDLIELPTGCKFHPRCPLANDQCRETEPPLEYITSEHGVACWRWQEAREALKAYEVK